MSSSRGEIRLRASRSVLGFPGYAPPAIESASARIDRIDAHEVVVVEFDFSVLGGSMGLATGETVCRAFELGIERGLPVLAITRSGGARMQEGMFALAQMPATLQARAAFREATGLPFVAWLRHPTTGGVFASFASTADVIVAEPGATIGFAGPRVAEAFTGQPLPAGSHTAASALEHGLVHALATPADLPRVIDDAVGAHISGGRLPATPALWAYTPPASPPEPIDAWHAVQRARDPSRRAALRALYDSLPLHAISDGVLAGERDGARILATHGSVLTVDDFRAVRAQLADLDATGEPLIVLVDVPGADPSAASEAAGIAREIAQTMAAALATPSKTLAIVTGEGGSGGAMALCAGADRLLIGTDAYFSVIAPEGAAAILRRSDIDQVARDLRCGPSDLVAFGLADALVDDRALPELLDEPSFEGIGRDRWRNPGRALTEAG